MHPNNTEMERLVEWKNLSGDLIEVIAGMLPCAVDRNSMFLVWKGKAASAASHRRKPQLPWLLRPALKLGDVGSAMAGDFFCITGNNTHHIRVCQGAIGGRCFGSYPGGWVFMSYGQFQSHKLANLRTGASIRLPDYLRWSIASDPSYKLEIKAAALSTNPDAGRSCVVGAICKLLEPPVLKGETLLVFSRLGRSYTTPMMFGDLADITYYDGAFHLITSRGSVWVGIAEDTDGGAGLDVFVNLEYRHFADSPEFDDSNPPGRYLVPCRGDLLMILRFSNELGGLCTGFRVFRMKKVEPAAALPHANFAWEELREMDGRALFLFHGSSRVFEAEEHPALKEGIYFLDERESIGPCDEVSFRYFLCSDNGHWSMSGNEIKRWSSPSCISLYSPPVWFVNTVKADHC